MAKRSPIERLYDPDLFTRYVFSEKGRGVIPSPLEYEELMRVIPPGLLISTGELNRALAERHKADYVPAGTAARRVILVARASKEKERLGGRELVPYWRTLGEQGELNSRYPGGLAEQEKKLLAEGHTLHRQAGKLRVADYGKKIFRL